MTYPRAHLVDPAGGMYHVCSRCVRRAWLCGTDPETGYNFNHRRQWLEDRILMLSELFAVDLYGYAVMSNHYHVVVKLDPGRVHEWTDEDVVNKWIQLFPRQAKHKNAEELAEIRKAAMLMDPERLMVLRDRLGSLSWFMRCLNEPLARLANQEDHCKGRFWEGRFQSQCLLDENAILAAMVYVDLNPVRAGIANDVTECEHTSLSQSKQQESMDSPIRALNTPHVSLPFTLPLKDYIELDRPGTAIKATDISSGPDCHSSS